MGGVDYTKVWSKVLGSTNRKTDNFDGCGEQKNYLEKRSFNNTHV